MLPQVFQLILPRLFPGVGNRSVLQALTARFEGSAEFLEGLLKPKPSNLQVEEFDVEGMFDPGFGIVEADSVLDPLPESDIPRSLRKASEHVLNQGIGEAFPFFAGGLQEPQELAAAGLEVRRREILSGLAGESLEDERLQMADLGLRHDVLLEVHDLLTEPSRQVGLRRVCRNGGPSFKQVSRHLARDRPPDPPQGIKQFLRSPLDDIAELGVNQIAVQRSVDLGAKRIADFRRQPTPKLPVAGMIRKSGAQPNQEFGMRR